jgi:hypothetical protein
MKDKQNCMTSFRLFDQKLNGMHAIHLSRSLRGAVLVVMILICACAVARGQIFFPDGKDHITVDRNAGPDGNGRIYVGDHSIPLLSPCHYRLDLEPSTHVARVGISDIAGLPFVFYQDGRGVIHAVSQGAFEKVDSQGNPCEELQAARKDRRPQAPKGASILVSNAADQLDITCDARFAVVVGSSDEGKPVSLVDLQASEEVDTFSDPRNGINVATCDDGESVLVTLGGDIPIVSVVRRFTISQAGTINDTGETLTLDNGGDINRVFAVPGSQVGIAITREDGAPQFSRLISFSIPGLNFLDSVTLTGQIGNAAAVSCDGTKVYVRSGNRGPASDVIEGFALDPVTGALNHTPILTINDVSFVNLTLFDNPLGVSHDATLLIASEPAIIPTPEVPAPQVTYFDAVTGARTGIFEDPDWTNPASISTVPCCAALPSPTPTPSGTPTPSPTATPTPTPCMGRCGPTPRPRPTPHPRPSPRPRTSLAGIVNGTSS